MDLRHLRYLIAVSEQSTFVKAAETLRLAQPALSRQIQALERELNTQLFVRGRRAVALTPAGSICIGAARSITARVDAAIASARMADAGRIGNCTIHVSDWAMWSGFSARLIACLREKEPGIEISLGEAAAGGLWDAIGSGAADIAISMKPPPEIAGLAAEQLLNDVVDTAILPMSHRLAGRQSIKLQELRREPLLIYDPSVVSYGDHDLEAAFSRAGWTPETRRLAPSSEAIMTMITAGMGWSLHRRSLRGKIPGVATVPLDDFELTFPVAVVWRKDETRGTVFTVIRRIRELAMTEYPELYAQAPVSGGEVRRSRADRRRSHGVEFRQLRYFVAAAEESSIGRAADRLGISQPALSRQLAILERDVGVELLSRSQRGVTPTAAGLSFRRDAEAILAAVAALPAEIARGERALSGRCNIAGVPSREVRDLLSLILALGSAEFPGVTFHIQNIPTPLQPAEIRKGAFDVGICHPFPGLVAQYPEVDCRELMPDTIDCALLSDQHPLASRAQLELSDLADVPFLFFQREFHPSFHDHVMEKFRTSGFEPRLGAMQEGLQTMWALTAAGEGWCLGFGGQRSDPPPGVVAIPIVGFSMPWGVVRLARRAETRPMVLGVLRLIDRVTGSRKDLSLEDARPR